MYRSVVVQIGDKYNVAFIKSSQTTTDYFNNFSKNLLSQETYELNEVKLLSKFLIARGIAFDGQIIITDSIPDCYLNINDSMNREIIEMVNNDTTTIFSEVLCFCS